MLSCKEATLLISQGMDRKLTLRERGSLLIHQAICKGCRAYERQLGFLGTATAAWRREHAISPDDVPSTQQGDRP